MFTLPVTRCAGLIDVIPEVITDLWYDGKLQGYNTLRVVPDLILLRKRQETVPSR
jgi:hypothetical protein